MTKVKVEGLDGKRMGIIPENERIPELEDKVQFFMSITPATAVNKTLYTRVKEENFASAADMKMWQREEIRRCREGHGGLSPKMYFYFNYCYITNLSGGRIPPDFRVIDHEWFKAVEGAAADSKGIVCVKRRRVGASWKEAGDVLHDCSFSPFFFVAMNSKSEKDTIELFKKVKFLYSNLPPWLRATANSSTKMGLDFSELTKDKYGNKIKRGTQSEILCKPPTDSAWEGLRISKWICDEAGKLPNLRQMWSFTIPALMEETRRVGTPILFGTSGEISGAGRDLAYMWEKHGAFDLNRFFFAGYNGIIYDEYGTDLKEDAIRWCVYERYKLRDIDPKQYNDFIQQYPMTVDEAFQPAMTGGVGNQIKVVKQERALLENPPTRTTGFFVDQGLEQPPIFYPSANGKSIIYEHPVEGVAYLGGADPADHDETFGDVSNLSTLIMRPQVGPVSPYLVFDYTDRPEALNDYFSQAALALRYYNNSKVLVERNRYRMIDYFTQNDLKSLLHWTPQGVMRLYASRRPAQIGVTMTPALKEYGEGLIAEYVDDYHELIPSVELLHELQRYGAENTDRAMAFMLVLMLLKERAKMRNVVPGVTKNLSLPRYDYRRTNDGKIVKIYE